MVVAQASVELLGVTPGSASHELLDRPRAVAALLEGSLLRLRARIIGASV
jgi:hypothetical protein